MNSAERLLVGVPFAEKKTTWLILIFPRSMTLPVLGIPQASKNISPSSFGAICRGELLDNQFKLHLPDVQRYLMKDQLRSLVG